MLRSGLGGSARFAAAAIVSLSLLCAAALGSCSSPFGDPGDSGLVIIGLGPEGSRGAAKALPAGVASIEVLVSAAGATLAGATLSAPSFSATIEVPAGAGRLFVASAFDSAGAPLYEGRDTIDVEAGATHELALSMERLSALSYNANGATSGLVPDPARALPGASVTVAANTKALARTGHSFGGWNTEAAGGGASYLPGAAFSMPAADATLYAVWTPASTDSKLSALTVNSLALTPSFSSNIVSYTAPATGASPSVSVTATANHPAATIQVKVNAGAYQALASGGTSGALTLDGISGVNSLVVLVTAEDGTTQSMYNVTISKTVTVTMAVGANGLSVSPSGATEMTPGAAVGISATAGVGYRFKKWTGTGAAYVASQTLASTTITVPVSNVALTAAFEEDIFADGDGTAGDPFLIADLSQLLQVHSYLDKHFKLMSTIDMSSESDWTPIGTQATPFTGSFDGNGGSYHLDNLTINDGTNEHAGLFGYVDGATISYVKLTNVNFINTYNYAGGLIGTSDGPTTVIGCRVDGFIQAYQSAGGLIGQILPGSNTAISECGTEVHISSSYTGSLGGLVGYAKGGSVQRCFARGDLTGHSAGTQNYVGGIAGWAENMLILDSYSSSTVEGDDGSGGLVGWAVDSTIEYCYSRGYVDSSGPNFGGMIGYANGGSFSALYYDAATSGRSDDDGRGSPQSTANMQSAGTYSGWDFVVTWDIAASYPFLVWE